MTISIIIAVLFVILSLGLIFSLPLMRRRLIKEDSEFGRALDECESLFIEDHDSIRK